MRPRRIRTSLPLLLAAAALAAALAVGRAPAGAHGLGMSLYDQLGGVHGIAPLVDDFVDHLWSNPVIVANPYVAEARRRYTKASLRFLLTEYLCDKTGGPMVYRGRDLKTAHAGLRITEKEWAAMLGDLRRSMRKFSVQEETREDLIALIDGTKKDIVAASAPGAPGSASPAPAESPAHGHAH